MNNYKELLFAIKTSSDCEKGGFDYKHFDPEKDGDVVETFKYIDIINEDKIQILEVKRLVSNLKIYGKKHYGYSSHDEKKIINVYNFDELTKSEYWNLITERYKFNQEKYKLYEESYIYEDEKSIKAWCYFQNRNKLYINFDKFSDYVEIETNNESFYGNISDLVLIHIKDYNELIKNEKIINLMLTKHKVQILENGYVIDNFYYEDIDYYKEMKSNGQ